MALNKFNFNCLSVCAASLFFAVPGYAASIGPVTTAGDYSFSTTEDLTQSGALIVGGTATISSDGNSTLNNTSNDFSTNQTNDFDAGGSLVVYDSLNGLGGDFTAGGAATVTADLGGLTGTFTTAALDITAEGSIIINSLYVEGNATITAQSGADFFDILFNDAQNIYVGGTLIVTGESILFDFTDGGGNGFERLNVGQVCFSSNSDQVTDTTIAGTGTDTSGCYTPPSAVPLPASLPLILVGLAGFGVLSTRRKSH